MIINNSKVGYTDPKSGAVYTSKANSSSMGAGSGSSIGNGMNSSLGSNMGSGMNMTSSTSSSTGASSSGVDVQQIKQQIQNIQSQLRQTSYTDAANRLQDVYDSLSTSR